MSKIIHFVQNLSLDITIGAVISSMFLAEIMEVKVSRPMLIGLAIAIWLIYTFDHLRDAYKTRGEAANPRHAFHQRHFKALVILGILVFVAGLYNLQFLPWATIEIGLVLAALSGLYFLYLMLSRKAINKELFAATVYVAGISTAPISLVDSVGSDWILLIVMFWGLAYSNLLIIPLFEEDLDRSDRTISAVTQWGRRRILRLITALLLLGVILNHLFLYSVGDVSSYLIIFLMHTTLIILILKPGWFNRFQAYRVLCDGIFFLPGLIFM